MQLLCQHAKHKEDLNSKLRDSFNITIGCLLTKGKVESVLKMFLLRKQDEISRKKYEEHFKVELFHLQTMERITTLSEHWLQDELNSSWEMLCEILCNFCEDYIEEIQLVMNDIEKHNVNGEYFDIV